MHDSIRFGMNSPEFSYYRAAEAPEFSYSRAAESLDSAIVGRLNHGIQTEKAPYESRKSTVSSNPISLKRENQDPQHNPMEEKV